MSIQVLVSTYHDSIERVPELLKTVPEEIDVLIVHQVREGEAIDYDKIFDRRKLSIHQFHETGLARSRNRAVALATADILLPTDDDISFLPEAFGRIESCFAARPDAQILTFQALDESGSPYKRYSARGFRHNVTTIRRVFSIEVAVRREAICRYGARMGRALRSECPICRWTRTGVHEERDEP